MMCDWKVSKLNISVHMDTAVMNDPDMFAADGIPFNHYFPD
jgi:hypothetical protein